MSSATTSGLRTMWRRPTACRHAPSLRSSRRPRKRRSAGYTVGSTTVMRSSRGKFRAGTSGSSWYSGSRRKTRSLRLLRFDDDDAVGAAAAVRRGARGVAQHLDGLDVARAEGGERAGDRVVEGDAVQHEQRLLIAQHGRRAANMNNRMAVGGTCQSETRDAGDEQLFERQSRRAVDVLGGDDGVIDRTRPIGAILMRARGQR